MEEPYRLGQNEKIALDIIYEKLNIPEEKRSELTNLITQEVISNLYQSIVNGLRDRVNNLLTVPYSLIQFNELKGEPFPSSETKKAIFKVKQVTDRFSKNRNLSINYQIRDMPTLKLSDILKKEGL